MAHLLRHERSSLTWLRCLLLLVASLAFATISFSAGMRFWWPGLIGTARFAMGSVWVVSAFLAWAFVLLALLTMRDD